MFTETDMRNQIIGTLDVHKCDVDEVCDVMRTTFGLVDINTIPADAYWSAMAEILAEDISCPLPTVAVITKNDVIRHCRQYGLTSTETNGTVRHFERSDVNWTDVPSIVSSYFNSRRIRTS